MNKPRPAIPWLQFLPAGIVFIAVVWMALQSREQLTETVLMPLLYVLWLGELVLKSFDQGCIWSLAVLAAVVMSLYLTRPKRKSWWAQPPRERITYQESGRIHFWRSHIRMGRSGIARSFRWAELRRLLISALAYRENKNKAEILEQLHSGQLRVPPEVGFILGLGDLQSQPDERPGLRSRIRQWLKRRGIGSGAPESSSDSRLGFVAQFIEQCLEVDHDNGNH